MQDGILIVKHFNQLTLEVLKPLFGMSAFDFCCSFNATKGRKHIPYNNSLAKVEGQSFLDLRSVLIQLSLLFPLFCSDADFWVVELRSNIAHLETNFG